MLLSQRGPAWAAWREGRREARTGGGQAKCRQESGIAGARRQSLKSGAQAPELSTEACLPACHRPLLLPLLKSFVGFLVPYPCPGLTTRQPWWQACSCPWSS